jgi:hypothetical protein
MAERELGLAGHKGHPEGASIDQKGNRLEGGRDEMSNGGEGPEWIHHLSNPEGQ